MTDGRVDGTATGFDGTSGDVSDGTADGGTADGGVRRRRVLETVAAGGVLGTVGHGLLGVTGSVSAAAGCDLAVTKTQDCKLDHGQDGTFTVQVCNVGDAECLEPVTVIDDLPAGLSYVTASGTGWSVSETSGIVTFEHPNADGLGPGTCLPAISLEVHLASEADWPAGTVENCVRVSTADDANPDNDGDCETLCLEGTRTFQGGVDDSFDTANGTESTTTSPGLQAQLDGYGPQRQFDDGGINAAFGHSFLDLFPDGNLGHICGATLEIRLRPEGSSLNSNDRLLLNFFGTDSPGWGRYLGSGNGQPGLLNYAWTPSNTSGELITLDLAALPLADGGTQSLLSALNDQGYLDVFVQDDTAVDFVRLTVDYCCDEELAGDCDLVAEKSVNGTFTAGGSGSYTVEVCNVGDGECTEPVTVTDDLPAGLRFASASGTGWSVSASGGTVTATHAGGVPPGGCLPPLTIDVNVADVPDLPAVSAIRNCVTVDGADDVDTTNNDACALVDCLEGTVVDTGGRRDDFDTSDGTESAEPRPAFEDWMSSNYGPTREFDEDVTNAVFGHSFTNLHRHGLLGEICEATLEIRMKPSGSSLDDNDRLSLRFHGEPDASGWGRYLGSGNGQPGLRSFQWDSSNTSGETFVLDLAALPEADGTTTSLIDELNDVGFLDVYVQDDTAVDYAELTVEYCCPGEPTGQCNLDVTKSTVGDFHYGETGQYEIVVCNQGEGECLGQVAVTDYLPAEVSYVSASGTGWSVSASGGRVVATHDEQVAAGECLPPLTVTVQVGEGEGTIEVENCVEALLDGEPVAQHCLPHQITPPPAECDLTIEKAPVEQFNYGSPERYEIRVCNAGDAECTEPVYVTDHLPDGVRPVNAGGSGWQATISGQSVEARHDGGLAPGDCLPPLFIEVEVASQAYFETSPTTVENCARIEAPADADDSNNVACVTHQIR